MNGDVLTVTRYDLSIPWHLTSTSNQHGTQGWVMTLVMAIIFLVIVIIFLDPCNSSCYKDVSIPWHLASTKKHHRLQDGVITLLDMTIILLVTVIIPVDP